MSKERIYEPTFEAIAVGSHNTRLLFTVRMTLPGDGYLYDLPFRFQSDHEAHAFAQALNACAKVPALEARIVALEKRVSGQGGPDVYRVGHFGTDFNGCLCIVCDSLATMHYGHEGENFYLCGACDKDYGAMRARELGVTSLSAPGRMRLASGHYKKGTEQ